MKWSERSSFEKAVLVLGCVCVMASAVLVILDLLAVFDCDFLAHQLLGVWWLSLAVADKRKSRNILCYIAAALHVAFGVLYFFF